MISEPSALPDDATESQRAIRDGRCSGQSALLHVRRASSHPSTSLLLSSSLSSLADVCDGLCPVQSLALRLSRLIRLIRLVCARNFRLIVVRIAAMVASRREQTG